MGTGEPSAIEIKRPERLTDSPLFDWASTLESASIVSAMTTKAEHYLHMAEQFAAMAQKAQAETVRATYEHLARSYRQLGNRLNQGFHSGAELDGLAERMVGRDRR